MADFKISFALVDDKKMKELNKTYRGREGTTDVLSFEVKEPEEEGLPSDLSAEASAEAKALAKEGVFWLGEVVVNKDQAKEQAKELGHSFEEEVAELVKHGVLHLLGKHHQE